MNNDYKTRVKRHQDRNCLFCEWLNSGKKGWDEFIEKQSYRLIWPDPEKKIPNEIPYVVILTIEPKVAGHTLVIWKYPYDDICDASKDRDFVRGIGEVISRYSQRLRERLLAEKVYPYSMCDHFEKKEYTTEHLHFHLLPRYPGAPKGEDLFGLHEKKAGVDWEATAHTMNQLAKLLRNDRT